jgi:hypothetical protein
MNPLKFARRLDDRIRRKGLVDTAAAAWNIGTGLLDYHLNPLALKTSKLPPPNWPQIRTDLEEAGLQVIPYRINVSEFKNWLKDADFPEYYVGAYGGVFVEKALEHYVSSDLLQLSKCKVFIDVAASSSPWLNIAPRLYGVKTLALDLNPPTAPVPGRKIAADATQMPFKKGTVDAMALHCAFEMFEGDADIRLVHEASSLLQRGGKMVILPLYLHHLYYGDSAPMADRRGLDYQGAKRVWREDGYRIRFSRKYNVAAFVERVVRQNVGFRLNIYYLENEKDVDPICYLKFVAMFDKL